MNVDFSIALLLVRVVFGVSLAAHGAQKLFGWWGGPGLTGFAGWLGSMGRAFAQGFGTVCRTR